MDRFPCQDVPLRTFVGYKHHTPSILGQTVANPNIDDNRCLQRCLILASEGGYKIIANRKMDDASVYSKWWKQPDKNKVLGVSIHEMEEAMDIRDNKAFDASEANFARLEALLKVSLNVFEVTLLPGYVDKTKEQFDLFTCDVVYKGKEKARSPLSLCILNDLNLPEGTPKHFLYIKDLNDFKHRIFRQSDAKNRNTTRNMKCRFCDFFFGSLAKPFMITKYKHIENLSMKVSSTTWRTRRLGCDSPTSDTKYQHRSSCTPTLSQPLMTRTDTSQSCCPV